MPIPGAGLVRRDLVNPVNIGKARVIAQQHPLPVDQRLGVEAVKLWPDARVWR